MLRKLNKTFEYSLFKFLEREPEINLFIIGDIENYGFEGDFQEVWAEYTDEGEYLAVLLRYRSHFIFYCISDIFDGEGFSQIIDGYTEASDISGSDFSIRRLKPYLKFKKTKEQHFAKLTSYELLKDSILVQDLKKATAKDAEKIFELRQAIREFDDFKTSLEGTKATLLETSGRTYYLEVNNKIVAAASTTAENKNSAMVVSVMTHPDFRRAGYATHCVSALCKELLMEGKNLCLFYDNPAAGNIYKRLGFVDIEKWISLFL